MREEELEKRLQSAFPTTTPPDEALHARIQSLQSTTTKSVRKRAHWKVVLVSAGALGVGVALVSRSMVAYVLYQHFNAPPSPTMMIETASYPPPNSESLGIRIDRVWREGDKVHQIYYRRGPKPGTKRLSYHLLYSEGRVYNWTEAKESLGSVLKAKVPNVPQKEQIVHTEPSIQNEPKLKGRPATRWDSGLWSIPWVVRLPDRVSDGQREWVLQQIHRSPENLKYWRYIWGIDPKTGRLLRAEYWEISDNAPARLTTSMKFTYNTPVPESFFQVPNALRKKPVQGEYPLRLFEPTLQPYVAPASWRTWWNELLLGR